MTERLKPIDGRKKELKLIFQPNNLLTVLRPIIPNISVNEIEQQIREGGSLLEKELGLRIEQNHQENLFLAIGDNNYVGAFLTEAGRFPLLNACQEQILALGVEKGKKSVSKLKRFSRTLISRILIKPNQIAEAVFNGAASSQVLTKCNLRLVVSIAKEHTRSGMPIIDLFQAGNIALMRAAEGFRPNRGKFSNYATWVIQRGLTEEIARNGYFLRLPDRQVMQIKKIYGIRNELETKLGREPSVEEIATRMKIKPKKVKKLLEISQQPLSLDAPLSEDEGSKPLYILISDDNSVNPEKEVARQETQEKVGKIIASILNPRERKIVEKHWGINGYHPHTLNEIGEELGITGEGVRQIEVKAFKKLLSHPVYGRKLKALI